MAFLIVSIVFLIRQTWLTSALTVLGTIVNGVVTKWVLARRTDAVKEEEDAYKDVVRICADKVGPDQVRARFRLV